MASLTASNFPQPESFKDPNHLTPIISIQTKVPAPNQPFASVNSDPGKVWADGNRTIVLKACSEWTTETVAMKAFDGSKRLRIVQDAHGAPIVFALSSASKLNCAMHVNDAPFGYQSFDITPTELRAVEQFDVLRSINGNIQVIAAGPDAGGKQRLCATTIPQPELAWDRTGKVVTGFDPKAVAWSQSSWPADIPISQVTICPSPEADALHIAVGTAATNALTASHYVLHRSAKGWTGPDQIPMVDAAVKVVDLCPGNIWTGGKGIFTLHERVDKTRGIKFDTLDKRFHFKMQVKDLGELRDIFANSNPWNMTDLVVASEKGVAFYNFVHPDEPPVVALPQISFKQVVCSEAVDPASPKTQTQLALFAVSDDDEMYYIRGTRPYATNKVAFVASGIPIAHNVETVSAQFNAGVNASEIVYIGDGQDEIIHMWLDSGHVWQHERLLVKTTAGGVTKYPAYLTSVRFETDQAASIGGDYPVTISSSSLVHASVNGRSRTISPRGSTFLTDSNGAIKITIPSTESLAGPQYTFSLFKFSAQPRPFVIDTSQRALRLLGGIRSADDLKSTKSTTGKPVFTGQPPEKLDDAAAALKHFPAMLHAADARSAQDNLGVSANDSLAAAPNDTSTAAGAAGRLKPLDPLLPSGAFGLTYERKSDGSTATAIARTVEEFAGWVSDAVEWVEDHLLGDVLRLFQKAVKTVFKFAVTVVGKAVSFVFRVAGKVLGFVIRNAVKLLAGMVGFLKEHLGLDLTGVLNWLSYVFDGERTRQTHSVLLNLVSGSITASKRLISEGEKKVSSFFDDVESTLSSVIKDPRHKPNDSDASPSVFRTAFNAFGWIFHNPIAQKLMEYNPLALLVKAAEEGIEEALDDLGTDFKMPTFHLQPVFAIITKFIEEERGQIQEFLTLLSESLPKIIETPSKVLDVLGEIAAGGLWTLLESARNLVVSLMEFVMESFDAVFDFISQTMKLGWISELWDDFTGVPFTTLNLFTWPAAAILNLVSLVLTGKFPFGDDGKAGLAGLVDELLAWSKPEEIAAEPAQARTVRAETPIAAAPAASTAAATATSSSSGDANQPQPQPQPPAAGMAAKALDRKYVVKEYPRIMIFVGIVPQLASCLAGSVGLYEALKYDASTRPLPSTASGVTGGGGAGGGGGVGTGGGATEMTPLLRDRAPVAQAIADSGPFQWTFSDIVDQNEGITKGLQDKLTGLHFCADLLNVCGRGVLVVLNEIYLDAAAVDGEDGRIARARNCLPYGTAILDFVMRFATACLANGGKIEAPAAKKGLDLACEAAAALSQLSCLVDNAMGLKYSLASDDNFLKAYNLSCIVAAGGGTVANACQAIMIGANKNFWTIVLAIIGNVVDAFGSVIAAVMITGMKKE